MVDEDETVQVGPRLFNVAALALSGRGDRALLSGRHKLSSPVLYATVAAWHAAVLSRRKWRHMQIDDPGDEAPPPRLRTPVTIHAPQLKRGVSPPPLGVHSSGWSDKASGWQSHKRAPNWLRKPKNFGGPVYFYLPDSSLWTTMPNGLFMQVDECSGVLEAAAISHNETLLRVCLNSWSSRASVTRVWRYKMSLFGCNAADSTTASQEAFASAEEARFTSSDAIFGASFGPLEDVDEEDEDQEDCV